MTRCFTRRHSILLKQEKLENKEARRSKNIVLLSLKNCAAGRRNPAHIQVLPHLDDLDKLTNTPHLSDGHKRKDRKSSVWQTNLQSKSTCLLQCVFLCYSRYYSFTSERRGDFAGTTRRSRHLFSSSRPTCWHDPPRNSLWTPPHNAEINATGTRTSLRNGAAAVEENNAEWRLKYQKSIFVFKTERDLQLEQWDTSCQLCEHIIISVLEKKYIKKHKKPQSHLLIFQKEQNIKNTHKTRSFHQVKEELMNLFLKTGNLLELLP